MSKANLIEILEWELDMLITKAHRSGLTYSEILGEVQGRLDQLKMQCEAEKEAKDA